MMPEASAAKSAKAQKTSVKAGSRTPLVLSSGFRVYRVIGFRVQGLGFRLSHSHKAGKASVGRSVNGVETWRAFIEPLLHSSAPIRGKPHDYHNPNTNLKPIQNAQKCSRPRGSVAIVQH